MLVVGLWACGVFLFVIYPVTWAVLLWKDRNA